MAATANAEPLYAKRKAVVTGSEEPPAVTTSEELSTEQDDEADVPSGIPEFWLNVLRAHSVIQAKVSDWHHESLCILVHAQDTCTPSTEICTLAQCTLMSRTSQALLTILMSIPC